jgi:predicted porin
LNLLDREQPSMPRMKGAAVIAALCLPCQGQAETSVSVYGLVDTTIQVTSQASADGRRRLYSVGDGAFTGTRLGFRGTEDLGAGLRVFFSLEQGVDPSSGQLMQTTPVANFGQIAATAGRAFGREALVGLTIGAVGTLTLGRQYTLANVFSSRFQPYANPNQEALALLVAHQLIRQDNMVKYVVDVGAFSFGASRTLGEGTTGSSWSAAAAYKQGTTDLAGYVAELDSFDRSETRRIQAIGGSLELTPALKALPGRDATQPPCQRSDQLCLGGGAECYVRLVRLHNELRRRPSAACCRWRQKTRMAVRRLPVHQAD